MQAWMPTTPAERVMWLALILLVAGYLGGQYLNRKHTKRIGNWIQAGLGSLGGRVAWRWSKTISAGAEVSIEESRPPYRNLVISYYLLTREFAPLWLWERLRGKNDLVTVRANLRALPAREFEIVPLGGRLRKTLDDSAAHPPAGEAPSHPFIWQELSNGLGFGMRGNIDAAICEKAKVFADTYGSDVERISVRKRSPHIMAFFRLGSIQRQPSAGLWKALGELAKG